MIMHSITYDAFFLRLPSKTGVKPVIIANPKTLAVIFITPHDNVSSMP
jgi:hypothetical protein